MHFAQVAAGNVGSHLHHDYALVGDGQDLAFRLEGDGPSRFLLEATEGGDALEDGVGTLTTK